MDRREFLGGAASVATLGVLAGPLAAADAMRSGPAGKRPRPAAGARFRQGVASGEPTPHGITLWTRLDGIERSASAELEVARDPDFRRVVARRRVVAEKSRDFTVHARVDGLEPAERYYYRFDGGSRSSSVGRFRTLAPPDSRLPAKIGVFSCQDWVPGFYTAHAGLAEEDDLDLVVCLGDYIYERAFYEPAVRPDTLGANGDGEVQTLAEYRQKYSLYHSDRNLREVRRRFPLVAVWDDHEGEDNYAGGLPGDKTEDRRVGFARRRRNAYRAFFEHMPQRPVRPAGRRSRRSTRVYRSYRIGRSAEILLLDQRQYRGDQPCGDELPPVPPCSPEELNDPARTMLGEEQKRWLKRRLAESDATWKLVGSPLMAMSIDLPPGNALNMDGWDGYGAERREILEHVAAKGIGNVSILSGDIHTFFAGDLTPTGRQSILKTPAAVATEFVAGSVTSLGIPETIADRTGAVPPEVVALLADSEAFRAQNPQFTYLDTTHRGYAVVEADARTLDVAFRAPGTTLEPVSPVHTLRAFEVAAGVPRVEVR